MNDPLIDIHDLLHKNRHEDALGKIYDKTRGLIKNIARSMRIMPDIADEIFFKQSNYEVAAHLFKESLKSREDDIKVCCALANAYSATDDRYRKPPNEYGCQP
ncbi:hypothetical protein [Pseudomonas sp. GD03944]|uniref:hypothetical protein n=1 Tax=Pseudomonas sp. GD03944 TaxID=2975409 RepID=UPI00244C4831|nr:hypothetical protein [Pseudomonas sp. GD03944]MDH1262045.1 hypothetical protein [Pseudomonas sp. GD03944]